MQIRSYAKINWALRILGKRADGYHDLETVFQTISLHDLLAIEPADRLTLTCDDPAVPIDERNLVVRAVRALGAPPVSIRLTKRIPVGGGLGGGSSNAAATLVALDEMFALRTPHERMVEIALTLGSDVPFFLLGGAAYGRGRGEELIPLEAGAVPLILLLPEEGVSTAEAFGRVRRYSAPLGIDAYRDLNPGVLVNDFEEQIFALRPHLRELKGRLQRAGAWWAGMSGSGSTIVGAFRGPGDRDAALRSFADVRALAAATL